MTTPSAPSAPEVTPPKAPHWLDAIERGNPGEWVVYLKPRTEAERASGANALELSGATPGERVASLIVALSPTFAEATELFGMLDTDDALLKVLRHFEGSPVDLPKERMKPLLMSKARSIREWAIRHAGKGAVAAGLLLSLWLPAMTSAQGRPQVVRDAQGRRAGTLTPTKDGVTVVRDAKGRRQGTIAPAPGGGSVVRDARGRRVATIATPKPKR